VRGRGGRYGESCHGHSGGRFIYPADFA
jgi:hypothetical protein